MAPSARRLPGVHPRDWTPELLDSTSALVAPPGHPSATAEIDKRRGVQVLSVFAHHPELAASFFPFNGHVLYGTSLTPRLRQYLVLRVAARRGVTYMWAEHVVNARQIGLTDEEIASIAFGPRAPMLGELESAALSAVDELVDDGAISEATWQVLAAQLDERQLIDLIFTVGCYETVGFLMRSINLEPRREAP